MNGPNMLDVLGRVAPLHVRWGSRPGLAPVLDRVQQHFQTARSVGMVARRMELHELRVGHDVDGWASARAATRSAIAFMPQLLRREDASAHRGD